MHLGSELGRGAPVPHPPQHIQLPIGERAIPGAEGGHRQLRVDVATPSMDAADDAGQFRCRHGLRDEARHPRGKRPPQHTRPGMAGEHDAAGTRPPRGDVLGDRPDGPPAGRGLGYHNEITFHTQQRRYRAAGELLVLGEHHGPRLWALAMAWQLVVVLAFGVYVSTAATVVARRHALVLKRLRTSDAGDRMVLAGLAAPAVGLALAQLVLLAVMDAAVGAPVPGDPIALVLAAVLGAALCLSAAAATTLVTPSPERAQVTTMPLVFVMLGGSAVLPALGTGTVSQALVALPGIAIGQLGGLAVRGEAWQAGAAGLPAALPSVLSLLVWTAVFGTLAARHFRWDQH